MTGVIDDDPARSCYRKHAYVSEQTANEVAKKVADRRGANLVGTLRAYHCDVEGCGAWHLTRDVGGDRLQLDPAVWVEIKRRAYERDRGTCRLCKACDGHMDAAGEFIEIRFHTISINVRSSDDVVCLCGPCKDTAIAVALGRCAGPDRTPDALRELARNPPP